MWRGTSYEEMSSTVLQQMIGRAGRPPYDTCGIAVIMTTNDRKKQYYKIYISYEKLTSGQGDIISNLPSKLIEHINSEIVLGSIRNEEDAINVI